MIDRFGHQLHVQSVVAPCRHCLRIPLVAEDMILISYRALPDSGPYAEVGPIFVHARVCERYADVASFPRDFLSRSLVIRAYDIDGRIADAVVAQPGEAEPAAYAFLQNDAIAEVHVRHISYTCFDFKIIRAA